MNDRFYFGFDEVARQINALFDRCAAIADCTGWGRS